MNDDTKVKTFTNKELNNILKLHKKWLRGDDGGVRANLRSADLSYADLRYANLSSADLSFADLSFADLSSADLRSANLRSANLRSADLRYADLSFADLRSADLRSANLRSANLRSATEIKHASCCWSKHGERGRQLLAVIHKDEAVYYCGCFRGTLSELKKYINDGEPGLKKSRMIAVRFVLARIKEMTTNE